ncbi:hypothetical protein SteCoe_29550 [Stentor coeruleus]|uniref:Uncharacterized protein n=1 Tax=Stentor coeruleus TaxID=5963 RepID=A0A1R2B5R3_9CILI|nr:hypothetical protein SteCoe_29550 [Stentor coeruleus]
MQAPIRSPMIRTHRTREDIIKALKKSVLATQRLEYCQKKSHPYLKSPPIKRYLKDLSVSPQPCANFSNSIISEKMTQGFSFSTISRFENNIFEKFKNRTPCLKKLTSEEKLLQEKRFLANKDMSQHTFEKKLKKIQDLRFEYDNAKHLAQIIKNELLEDRFIERDSKLRLKFNKLDIRMNKGKCGYVKKAWISATTAASICLYLHEKFIERKAMKVKCKKIWKKLKIFTIAAARWTLILYEKRKIRKLTDIKNQMMIQTKHLIYERIFHRTILVGASEAILTIAMLIPLMRKWKKAIIKIQRWCRKCLLYKNRIYTSIFDYWKNNENIISLKNINKKKGKSIFKTSLSLSDEARISHIRSFVKNQVKKYAQEMTAYKKALREDPEAIDFLKPPEKINILSDKYFKEITDHIENLLSIKRQSQRRSQLKINN